MPATACVAVVPVPAFMPAFVPGRHIAVSVAGVPGRCAQWILDFRTDDVRVGRVRHALPVGGSVIDSRHGFIPVPRVLVTRTARAIRHDLAPSRRESSIR
ncbi:hypothetical protein [Blastococcus aggregatus]|uniref:hypothetical protein n=1 Tax=Blastococcus aggregatus TaxID=38502 RepID=UPI0015965510|nr:hypothetical protein [Blastococcus aggregatus]